MPYFGNEPSKQAIKIGDNTILSSNIADGVIINADIKSDAAIAMSKTALSAGTGITLATNTLNVDAAQTQITSVGTIGTGAWQGTKVASAYLDDDTAHLSGTQTFSGAKTFTANPIIQSDTGTLNFYNAAGTQRAFLQLSSTGLIIDTDSFLEFKPNNTTAMYINSSGDVGIGITSPTTYYEKVLHINESSGSSAIHMTNNTTGTTRDDGIDLICYQDDLYIWNRESGGHVFIGTNATERMRITSGGFVGIQTVDNSGDYTPQTISAPLHILQKTASQGYGLAVQGNSNSQGGRIGIGEADSNFSTRANVIDIGFDSNTDFIFSRTGKDMIIGVNSSEVARFDTLGNFGIGGSGSNLNARIVRGFSANKGLVIETAQPAIQLVDTDNTGRYFTMAYEQGAKTVYMHNQSNGPIRFDTNGLARINITGDGHLIPETDNSYDLGSSSKGWRNIYTNDLNLSNMDSDGNDVDGTKGSWTIQEGEDDLFLINRTNNKKYKFKLEMV